MSLPAEQPNARFFNRSSVVRRTSRHFNRDGDLDWEGIGLEETIDLHRCGRSEGVSIPVGYIDGRPFRKASGFIREINQVNISDGSNIVRDPDGGHWEHQGHDGARVIEFFHPNGWDEGFDSDDHRQAITECLLKLNRGKVDYGQYLGEAISTANSLAFRASDFLAALRAIKRGRVPQGFGARRLTGDGLADLYLEWKFGWAPLASDIYNLMGQALNGLDAGPPLIHAKRVTYATRNGMHRPNGYKEGPWSASFRNVCSLWAKMSDIYAWKSQGRGLENPLSLGWEFVPYSFAIDWFVPVGDCLEAMTASAGLSFVDGYHSRTRYLHHACESERCGASEYEQWRFERQPYGDFPSGWKPYAVQNPFNTQRVGLAAALWSQVKSGPSRPANRRWLY